MNSLQHHGILGQKWGVRRYQNEDGSYTPEGRLRRTTKSIKREAKESQRIRKERRKQLRRISKMSDAELDNYISRMSREKRLRDLYNEDQTTSEKFLRMFLDKEISTVVLPAAIGATAFIAKEAVRQNVGSKYTKLYSKLNDNERKQKLGELATYMFPNPNKKK